MGQDPRTRAFVSRESQKQLKIAIQAHSHPNAIGGSLRKSLTISSLLGCGVCLLLVGALVFWNFLFGNAVLLYKDIGTDSLNSYYPDFVNLSSYIRHHGFPSWSFQVGMGQDLSYATGFLVWQPVCWLPKDWIAGVLVYQHLLKVLVAGLIFFRLLQLFRLQSPAPLLGSLLLSFSAFMCMGSCWYPLADEVVCFAAILWGAEEALQTGRWLVLALAMALVGMITPFHLYLAGLLLIAYIPARLFLRFQKRKHRRAIPRFCLTLGIISVIGVGLGAVVTLPYLYSILNSPRGSGTTSLVSALGSRPFLGMESPLHYVTAVLRLFANDMLGAGDDFRGWQNYLEAPITYCGLLCLLVFPQVFVRASRRSALIFSLILLAMLIPTVFPWFRYLFWLFQGDYYRTHSLLSVIALITLTAIALSSYSRGELLNLWLLSITALLLIGTLYFPLDAMQSVINQNMRVEATIFLLTYVALLAGGQILKRQAFAAYLLVATTAIELVAFDRVTILNRKFVTKQELTERVGYNDETIEAVRDIKAADSSFFRITKLRPSTPSNFPSLNDAMVFGYYGTSCYSSFNSVNYTDFLTAVGSIRPSSELQTRWAVGVADSALLSAFACEKYLLSDDPARFRMDLNYEPVRSYGKDMLFRNRLFLPFGLTYNRFINEADFLKLPGAAKQETLMRAVVLNGDDEAAKRGLSPITLSELEEETQTKRLPEVVAAQRETALHLTSFDQTKIQGGLSLERKAILVLQTPFDRGWRALQGGQLARTLRVDAGLLGVEVTAGTHDLELRYRNPWLPVAILISLASIVLLAVARKRRPKLALPG